MYIIVINHQEKILRGKILSRVNGKHCYGYNNCCSIVGNFFPTADALIGYFKVT